MQYEVSSSRSYLSPFNKTFMKDMLWSRKAACSNNLAAICRHKELREDREQICQLMMYQMDTQTIQIWLSKTCEIFNSVELPNLEYLHFLSSSNLSLFFVSFLLVYKTWISLTSSLLRFFFSRHSWEVIVLHE